MLTTEEIARVPIDQLNLDGLDLNLRDAEGVTPLGNAIALRNLPLVTLLVSRGAEVNRTTALNKRNMRPRRVEMSPLARAVFNSTDEIIIYLLKNGAQLYPATRTPFSCPDGNILSEVLDRSFRLVHFIVANKALLGDYTNLPTQDSHTDPALVPLERVMLNPQYREVQKKIEFLLDNSDAFLRRMDRVRVLALLEKLPDPVVRFIEQWAMDTVKDEQSYYPVFRDMSKPHGQGTSSIGRANAFPTSVLSSYLVAHPPQRAFARFVLEMLNDTDIDPGGKRQRL